MKTTLIMSERCLELLLRQDAEENIVAISAIFVQKQIYYKHWIAKMKPLSSAYLIILNSNSSRVVVMLYSIDVLIKQICAVLH